MRLIVTTDGTSIDDMVSQVFGRCRNFLVVEAMDDGTVSSVETVPNEGASQEHGAGIRAAEQVASFRPDAVLSGDLGPKGKAVLEDARIPVFRARGIISGVLASYVAGELEPLVEVVRDGAAQEHGKSSDEGDRILFPLLEDNGKESRISEHFGHAPYLAIYDEGDGTLTISENTLVHSDPSKSPVDQVMELYGPSMVVGIGMGNRAITLFKEKGVTLLDCKGLATIQDVLQNRERLGDLEKGCGHH